MSPRQHVQSSRETAGIVLDGCKAQEGCSRTAPGLLPGHHLMRRHLKLPVLPPLLFRSMPAVARPPLAL